MNPKIIALFLFVSLITLVMADAFPDKPQSEAQFLGRSQGLTRQHNYAAALETLDLGLAKYPNSVLLTSEFRKNSQLYIVHEISRGYQRIDRNPHDVQAYIRISEAFWLAGQRIKAFEVLVDGTSANQTSAPLWAAIANLEELSGRHAEAEAVLREAKRYESIN